MKLARTLVLFALSSLPLACGGQPTAGGATPSEVTERFLAAVQRQDQPAYVELLTEAARAGFESDEGFALSGARLSSFELGAESIDGARAEVDVTIVEDGDAQEMSVLLRRAAPGWRVFGLRIQLGDGSMTLDLEQTAHMLDAIGEQLGEQLADGMQQAFDEMQRTWEQGGTAEEIAAERARFDALAPVSVEQHDAAWRVDVAGSGRPVAEVLEELLAPVGFALAAGGHAERLARPVALELAGVSRVEAVERVAAAAGLHPRWPDDGSQALAFAAGERAHPVAFAGPFLVEVTGVTENAPQPTGTLTVAVRALGLAPPVLAFQTEMVEALTLERVRGADGQPLTDEAMSTLGTPQVSGACFTYAIDTELTGLLRGVEAIEPIPGVVRLRLPATVESVPLEGPDAAPRELGLGTLSVVRWGESSELRLEGEREALADVTLLTAPRKADGAPLGMQYGSSTALGARVQVGLQCPEAPAAIDVKACAAEELQYPFTLPRVPLARFGEQPERLEPLSFPGAAPLALELVGPIRREGDDARATVSIASRCNKDAETVVVDFVYLGADGAELEDTWHTLTGEFDHERGAFGPVVAAGATARQDTFAAFAPPNAVGIRFDLVRVEFPDGTVWEAE